MTRILQQLLQPTRLRQRAQGLAATLTLLALVVGFPIALIAIGAAPWNMGIASTRATLTAPDDGTLAMSVIAVIGWLAWLVLTTSVALAIVGHARHASAPAIPGLWLAQRAAGQLVATAALLFVAAPPLLAAFPAAPAHAAGTAPLPPADHVASNSADQVDVDSAAPAPPRAPALDEQSPSTPTTTDYVVRRGDSLWRIAERILGDGSHYTDLVDLNRDVLGDRPDFITPGTVLRVPDTATPAAGVRKGSTYVVHAGDTLSGIAAKRFGDVSRYRDIFEASRGIVQADGEQLTDPDLIRPGWTLTLPAGGSSGSTEARNAAPPTPPPATTAPAAPGESEALAEPSAEPNDGTAPHVTSANQPPSESRAATDQADSEFDEAPDWLLPGLSGAGTVLAARVLVAVRAHRRTQLRYRRPGQRVSAPPRELVAVEKSAQLSGAPFVESIVHLDRALRHLAAASTTNDHGLPDLIRIVLERESATLHLAAPAALPDPWTGHGTTWSTTLSHSIPDEDEIAPYPLLVTIGRDDAGRLHLINLEHLGAVTLAGDTNAATALARHVAAELTLNPWSLLVETDLVGIGSELVDLDRTRLRHHAPDRDDESSPLPQITDELLSAARCGFGDPDPYRGMIIAGKVDGAEVTALVEAITTATTRLGACALLVAHAGGIPGSVKFDLSSAGRLHIDALGLDLVAAGLSTEEAAACAAIIAVTRESQPEPIPVFSPTAEGWRAMTDQAGALHEELTEPRDATSAGDASLLPETTREYVEAAATTPEDVEQLAPIATDGALSELEDTDPDLEKDLAAWADSDGSLPRLHLLGPVRAHARGNVVAVAKRRPYFIELLAFIALHPEGVSARTIATAFGISQSRARTDVGFVRDWLGTNPRTGNLHLPRSNTSGQQQTTGYRVEDLLVDVDLFRRLRARGQARGSAGIADLKRALDMVSGQPFDQLREHGWTWLFEEDRLHETIPCAIVDVAHIVVVDALAQGDLAAARQAAEIACRAAPYDEICTLDLIKVAEAEGHRGTVSHLLDRQVFNRTDDDLPPIDLGERTKSVVAAQAWGTRSPRKHPA